MRFQNFKTSSLRVDELRLFYAILNPTSRTRSSVLEKLVKHLYEKIFLIALSSRRDSTSLHQHLGTRPYPPPIPHCQISRLRYLHPMAIVGECKGGLCNRILPLATYLEIPQATGLQIKLRWKPDANCQAEFSDLFQNSFDINGKIPKGVFRMSTPELRPNHAAYSIEQLITEHETRGFVALTLVHPDPKIQNLNHIRSLRPTPALQEKILQATQALQLDRSVIGVHARCTDRRDFHYYKRQITENVDPSQRVFICSDEAEVEDRLKKEFGDRIVSYKKSRYVEKIDPHAKWHHNLIRSKESVQEALVDLYLLAKTDIQIYDEKSTFATCAKILGDERHALQHRK